MLMTWPFDAENWRGEQLSCEASGEKQKSGGKDAPSAWRMTTADRPDGCMFAASHVMLHARMAI
jgi:hypothetical protein